MNHTLAATLFTLACAGVAPAQPFVPPSQAPALASERFDGHVVARVQLRSTADGPPRLLALTRTLILRWARPGRHR